MKQLSVFGAQLMDSFSMGATKEKKRVVHHNPLSLFYHAYALGEAWGENDNDFVALGPLEREYLELDVLTTLLKGDVMLGYETPLESVNPDGVGQDTQLNPETSSFTLESTTYKDGQTRTKVRNIRPVPKKVKDLVSVLTGLELAKNVIMEEIAKHDGLEDDLKVDTIKCIDGGNTL
jgi:hypothetical protein